VLTFFKVLTPLEAASDPTPPRARPPASLLLTQSLPTLHLLPRPAVSPHQPRPIRTWHILILTQALPLTLHRATLPLPPVLTPRILPTKPIHASTPTMTGTPALAQATLAARRPLPTADLMIPTWPTRLIPVSTPTTTDTPAPVLARLAALEAAHG
jgi:hypothetical protein